MKKHVHMKGLKGEMDHKWKRLIQQHLDVADLQGMLHHLMTNVFLLLWVLKVLCELLSNWDTIP